MKHDFEERRQRRLDNARNRAAKSQAESTRLFERSDQMASAIPMGQPILVGHHAEGRDRRYRQSIHDTMGKSVAMQKKAEYYNDKAYGIENDNAISSDDPQALQKLREKLNSLQALQTFMKAANKLIRKGDKEGFLKLGFGTEKLWAEVTAEGQFGGKGFPSFRMTNNGANIRRIAERIKGLERQESKPAVDKTINGIRIFENREANRLQIIFEGKPDAEIRKQLKGFGFRWSPSESAWQRHISDHAAYTAEWIANKMQG
ncbi:DUF3560 domain-containing protein [Mucilaginibacter sp. SG564]|uniref:DUF3560 domain-containing protein n=1 Tax=Mucilaginibacter sp. SG564 TaxID=2587022 RepID=UPI001553CA40|nr:DUF3560 domain-containing protein [Mucilaginibacter sp. SG564]NOW95837.1 hypothetical protein [Mucilaginibacter sp. SG564]